MEPVHIVCLKWGDKYPAEYVNRLYRMVSKHLTLPFVFHCLTENTQGLDEAIHVLPLQIEPGLKGWWYKLQLFKDDFYGLSGQVMFLDLDVVILANIDALFQYHPEAFVIIKDLQSGKIYNSSVFKFRLGTQTHIWQRFLADKTRIMARMHGDQDWISECVNDAVLWPSGWVVSFKKECNARAASSYGYLGKFLRSRGWLLPKGEAEPPAGAKIVYFHGKPDPDDVVNGPYDMWKQASWIEEQWRG